MLILPILNLQGNLGQLLATDRCSVPLIMRASDESAVLIRQLIEATKQAKQMAECLAVGSFCRLQHATALR
jgi:hypothetical protein